MAIVRNRIKSYAYGDRKTEDVDLNAVNKLRRVILQFDGDLGVSGGTTDGTLVQDGLLQTVAKQLELIADGRTIIDTDGRAEYFRRAILTGSPGMLVEPAVTAGTNPTKFNAVVDMDTLVSAARFAGRINVDLLQTLILRVKSGEADGEVVTGGDRTEALSGTVDVIAEYDEREFRGGHRKVSKGRLTESGATDDGRIIIPSGQLIEKILLVVVDNGARDNDLLTRVKAQIGESRILRDLSFDDIRAENIDDYGLELSSGDFPYDGLAVIDFDKDRNMNPEKLFDTRGLKSNIARLTLEKGAGTGTSYVEAIFYGVASPNKPK
jgi:hypothetical protein